ncbi:MAG: aminotransferase class IV [Thermonemataceae bacterium]|nr:aminotransferase class IV [Thermonemataceae bacterium]
MYCYNESFYLETQNRLDVFNRAFEYGDGLFETIIFENQELIFWEKHFDRLQEGMLALHFNIPNFFSASYLKQYVLDTINRSPKNTAYRVRLSVWRDRGGLYTPQNHSFHWLIKVSPFQRKHHSKKAFFFEDVKLSYSSISPYKTLNALPYILASIAKEKRKLDDAIMLSCDNYIAESISANIFWIKDNCLFYPSLKCGGKKGIMQSHIVETAKHLLIKTKEGLFRKEDLLQADAIFTSNVASLDMIEEIEGKAFAKEHHWVKTFRELR